METVRAACEAGVDALIVQDLGLARLIAQAAPDMPIHASTQMSLHNLSGVQLLEPFGYTRAVLAREMSAEEIERVAGAHPWKLKPSSTAPFACACPASAISAQWPENDPATGDYAHSPAVCLFMKKIRSAAGFPLRI